MFVDIGYVIKTGLVLFLLSFVNIGYINRSVCSLISAFMHVCKYMYILNQKIANIYTFILTLIT